MIDVGQAQVSGDTITVSSDGLYVKFKDEKLAERIRNFEPSAKPFPDVQYAEVRGSLGAKPPTSIRWKSLNPTNKDRVEVIFDGSRRVEIGGYPAGHFDKKSQQERAAEINQWMGEKLHLWELPPFTE